jgi:hypothetical protein
MQNDLGRSSAVRPQNFTEFDNCLPVFSAESLTGSRHPRALMYPRSTASSRIRVTGMNREGGALDHSFEHRLQLSLQLPDS